MSPELGNRNRTSDRIFEPDYLADAASASTEELQKRRKECAGIEEEASYTRRLIQGKIDILRHVRAGETADPASLVAALPSILADEPAVSRGQRHLTLPVPEMQGRREVDRLLESVLDPASLSREKVDEAIARLKEAESRVSGQRRRLLDLIDAIDEELVARYQREDSS
ncbi:MAG: hypothetical protein ACRDIU_05935 [Actinomycetota bacterium]